MSINIKNILIIISRLENINENFEFIQLFFYKV